MHDTDDFLVGFDVIVDENDTIEHYGTPRHSGRYPWGSGEDPYQKGGAPFLKYVDNQRKKGLTETQIAEGLGITVKKYRARIAISDAQKRQDDYAIYEKLKAKGYSNVAIGRKLGMNESSVRSLADKDKYDRKTAILNTANMLEDSVKKNRYVDIGLGTEIGISGAMGMGITKDKLEKAVVKLTDNGYKVMQLYVTQLGTGQKTTTLVLTDRDVSYKELMANRDKIALVGEYSKDGGRTFEKAVKGPINSISSDRVKIKYAEEGGVEKDGVIELRRGVPELSLGNNKYAQVRIGVDGTHYLKGMAVYSDDMPKGYDVVFNTNKHQGTDKMDVLKPMKEGTDPVKTPERVFGTTFRQTTYKDKDGKEHISAVNIVREEGEWGMWSKNLASQFLSKQTIGLADKQLTLAKRLKEDELNEILSTSNPTVKKKLLESYADGCDSDAVHLKAAALPRQQYQVILPFRTLKNNECYSTNYKEGEELALIRYPHGGTFEIPLVRVTSKNKEAKSVLGNDAKDAIGINSKVAERLSGADFDGDTVLAIPTRGNKIVSTKALKELEGFDPKALYKLPDSAPKMTEKAKQVQMGKVSNLITDMTLAGADIGEIARAVKHSMVVIDAAKHHLDWRKSELDNNIAELKEKYQGSKNAGAGTLISRAKGQQRVDQRSNRGYTIDPETGKKVFLYTGDVMKTKDPVTGKYIDRLDSKGNPMKRQTISTKMYEADDASALLSKNPTKMELLYRDYANHMKRLADKARKILVGVKDIEYSPSAKKIYQNEVDSLNAKLILAESNKPKERKAQILANVILAERKADNPNMSAEEEKKESGRALIQARDSIGAKKQPVVISEKEWAAIQAGAITPTKLRKILDNTSLDSVKALATPRDHIQMTSNKIQLAKSYLASGYTWAEISTQMGVPVSTLQDAVKGE